MDIVSQCAVDHRARLERERLEYYSDHIAHWLRFHADLPVVPGGEPLSESGALEVAREGLSTFLSLDYWAQVMTVFLTTRSVPLVPASEVAEAQQVAESGDGWLQRDWHDWHERQSWSWGSSSWGGSSEERHYESWYSSSYGWKSKEQRASSSQKWNR